MKKRILALLLAGVMALGLCACGGGADEGGEASAPAEGGNVVAIAMGSGFDTMDPGYCYEKYPALVINALGDKEPFEIEFRTVYLDDSAVEWIINRKCKLLVSDIYESTALHGVFLKLFANGVTTVCDPVKLGKLPESEVLLTALFPLINVTQMPCRLVAEF